MIDIPIFSLDPHDLPSLDPSSGGNMVRVYASWTLSASDTVGRGERILARRISIGT